MTASTLPAAIYGRISIDPEFTLSGVDRHNRLCYRSLKEHPDWELAPLRGSLKDPKDEDLGRWPSGYLVDNHKSGSGKKVRPEYNRLMTAVDAGQVKVILSYSQARLFRNPKERVDGFTRLAKAKVRLEFHKGASYDLSDATSRMVAGIIAETDEWYLQITSENQRETAADHANQGAAHGKRSFGWELVRAPGEKRGGERSLTLNEKEARYLPDMYRMADPDGEHRSLWEIGGWLDDRGVLTVTGMSWREAGTTSLTEVLCNARNIGYRERKEGWDGNGHRPYALRGGPELTIGRWFDIRPITDDDLFWRVREDLTKNERRRPGPKWEAQHLFTSWVFCENGHPMYVQHNRSRPRWTCQTCWITRSKDQVEAKAERFILKWMSENGPYDRAMTVTLPADLAAQRTALEGYRKMRRRILSDFYNEVITQEERDEQLKEKDAQIKDAEEKYREASGFWDERDDDGLRGDAFAAQWEKWGKQGEDGMKAQREIVGRLIKRVVIHRAGRTLSPSSRLITIEPARWAGRLPDPAEVAPPPVPDAFALTARGKAVAVLSARPGAWLSRNEVATAMGRADEAPSIVLNLLQRMVTDGIAERRDCQYGTAVENGDETIDQMRARLGHGRGVACHGYRLTEGAPVPVDRSGVIRPYRPPVRKTAKPRACPVDGEPIDGAAEFCSDRCRAKAHYRVKHGQPVADPGPRTCARDGCGNPIPATRPANAIYCGESCKGKAWDKSHRKEIPAS